MTTITREWLQQTITEYEANRDELPFGLDDLDPPSPDSFCILS